MYVQCERCQAEYEFDDALVSERGTTVKCTSCGHQFKIKRSGAGDGDRWKVETKDGRAVVFSSLKELQRAIVAKTVSRNDELSRTGSPPRPLGSIAELEPFFEQRQALNPSIPDGRPMIASTRPPPPPPPPPPGGSLPPAGVSASLAPPRQPMRSDPGRGSKPSIPPPLPARAMSGRPAPASIEVGGPLAPMPQAEGPWSGDDTPTHALRRDPVSAPPPVERKNEEKQQRNGSQRPPAVRGVGELQHQQVTAPMPIPPKTVPPAANQAPTRSDPQRVSASDMLRGTSPSLPAYSHPEGRRVGGWVVGVALLAGVAAIGFYMVQKSPNTSTANAAGNTDPRVQSFLAGGEAALAQGNLELAKENFDKASALSERNADVLLAVARLAAARADIAWLKQKLVVVESDEARVNKQSLDDLSLAARRAADDAMKGAPDDAALVRARIDALRIAGEGRTARPLVDKILSTGSQPETAYVLAALDLAEADPPWSLVLSRLRAAAAGEGTSSRARAALVYALARSGDGVEARKELERLAAQPRVHPLLPALRGFVERTSPEGKDGGAPTAAVDVNRLPNQVPSSATPSLSSSPARVTAGPPSPSPAGPVAAAPNVTPTPKPVGEGPAPAPGNGGGALPSDPRTLIRLAEAAKGKRDLDRARTLYEAALAKSPSDSEALAGLGDVTRSQGDTASAQGLYKRALGANPSYLPALIGLADVQWDGGDKSGAQKAYRDIVDRFPEPAYPARVKQRAESGGGGGGAAPAVEG